MCRNRMQCQKTSRTDRAMHCRIRSWALILSLTCTFAGSSCNREKRSFRPSAPGMERMVRLTDYQPGENLDDSHDDEKKRADVSVVDQYDETAYAISEGKQLYSQFNCVGCHAHGGGGMGVPLMDDEWIYGHEPNQVFASIVQGRPNGMPSFGGKISTGHLWELVAYVRSLGGLVAQDTAPGRDDDMKTSPPENSTQGQSAVESGPSKATEMPQ